MHRVSALVEARTGEAIITWLSVAGTSLFALREHHLLLFIAKLEVDELKLALVEEEDGTL